VFCKNWIKIFELEFEIILQIIFFLNFKLILQCRVVYLKLAILQVCIWNPVFRFTAFHAGDTAVYGGITYLIQQS
jgi:hypothetical protein